MDLFNSPIKEVFFEVNSNENLNEISKILTEEGKTDVNINFVDEKILENLNLKIQGILIENHLIF